MNTTEQVQQLLGLADAVATTSGSREVIDAGLPVLREIAAADAALVVSDSTPHLVTASAGTTLEVEDLADLGSEGGGLTEFAVPASWGARGISRAASCRLPGHLGFVLLAWSDADAEPTPALDLALKHLHGAAGRAVSEEDLADLTSRVDNAQHLANMGDYDWHIPTDTNRWSDQLYRIYGYEPQSFNASYEKFLSNIHPEDRERIQGIHQQAYASGEPYQMIERIVRPDGEVRFLSSNGQVVTDASGSPIRMRGTCIDITERVHAEEEREAHAARVHEEQTRRQAALEINDSVVQGLTAALYALELDDTEAVRDYVRRTLDSARAIITGLVGPQGSTVAPGDLVRSTPPTLGG